MGCGASSKQVDKPSENSKGAAECTPSADTLSELPPPPPPPPEWGTSTGHEGVIAEKSSSRTLEATGEPSKESVSEAFFGEQSSLRPAKSEKSVAVVDSCVSTVEESKVATRLSVNIRSFLPERCHSDVEKRYDIDSTKIGEGGYGQVFIARDREVEDRIVVVKKVVKETGYALAEAFYSEVKLMKDLDHPNICKLYEFYDQGRHAYFIMEYCEGGELFDRIVENKYIDEEMSANVVRQVASALCYAHGRKIAHRDIKPENVVFCSCSSNDQTVKLIDWGLGICFANEVMHQAVGSSSYCAPEVVISAGAGTSYTCQCDLWSLGVLSYVMLCGKPPFWGTPKQLLQRARDESYPIDKPPWDKITDNGKDFIRKLLKADPDKRMPIEETIAHPWLTSVGQFSNCAELEQALTNIKQFSNTSRFQALCVAAVAKQLDHRCLRRVHRVFRDIDTKGDGVLHFHEVAEGFKKIFGEQSTEYKNVAQTFEQMDLDGSGTIDYTEFCAAGMGQFAIKQDDAVWAAFKSFDIDDSGDITKENLEKILSDTGVLAAWSKDVCEEVAQEILNRFARTGTNAIQYEEWKELMQGCWQERAMTEEQETGDQPMLIKNWSNVSMRSGKARYDNKTIWAYEALAEANGLSTTT